MNATQDFVMLYQFVLEKEAQLSIYVNAIRKAIDKKKFFKV